MSYENPEVPHDMNVSRASPFAELLKLAAGLAVLVAVVGGALYLGGGRLARLVPFETEKSWTGNEVIGFDLESCGAGHAEIEQYIQRLTADLSRAIYLPAGMTVEAHYTNMDIPNAFATLGGHIVITSGLYRRMPSENALSMVIAHEIGHIKARDPISGVGGGAALSLAMALLTGQVEGLTPHLVRLVQLGYSRQAERTADDAAIGALIEHYGHAGGGAGLFQVLADYKGGSSPDIPSLLSSHPSDADRIERLEAAARDWDSLRAGLTRVAIPVDSATACREPSEPLTQ